MGNTEESNNNRQMISNEFQRASINNIAALTVILRSHKGGFTYLHKCH